MRSRNTLTMLFMAMVFTAAAAGGAWAEDAAAAAEPAYATVVALDTFWVLFAGALVFFMNTGFGLLESGLARSKNAVNILAKNFVVFALASIGFWIIGWGLMFGNGNGFFGSEGLLMLSGADNSPATGDAYAGAYSAIAWTGVPLEAITVLVANGLHREGDASEISELVSDPWVVENVRIEGHRHLFSVGA